MGLGMILKYTFFRIVRRAEALTRLQNWRSLIGFVDALWENVLLIYYKLSITELTLSWFSLDYEAYLLLLKTELSDNAILKLWLA